ncbi:MAG: hypothetical protein E6G97_17495 [Alphaproteobacteria bacterium]|nr:MAG: hypothetical protein E6G97_17495 [Alphaproteobacteria bacterium]
MSCSLIIQSLQATAQGTGSILHVTVVASGCKTLQLIAQCSGVMASHVYTLTGAASETVTVDLAVNCPCGTSVTLTANCVDPTTLIPIPGCASDTYIGPIQCTDPCCVAPQITYVPGACNANNERSVTFTIVFNVPSTLPSTCFPLVGYLAFGDTTYGPAHTITSAGTFSFTDTHPYNATAGGTYQASFVYILPSSCPPVPISVNVAQCTADCCVAPTIQTIVGPCNALGQRDVQFEVSMNVSNLACTYVFEIDFGDNQNSTAVYLTSSSTQPVVISHTYNAQTQTSATATLHFTLPTNCPDVSIPVNLGPVCPVDCCPVITDVVIDIGPCDAGCKSPVTIKTFFSPPSAVCQAEALQWHFFDRNGNAITNVNSNAFLTSGASPNVQTFVLDPADAPITAQLTGLQYPNCVGIVRTIDLKPCDVPPACPTIHSFSANVMGCENVAGKCLRRVEFTVDADVFAGCGPDAGTKLEIDFDDGDQTQLQFNVSGHYTVTASHHYPGGDYDATLTVLNPSQCLGQLIKVHVPACAPEDCKMDPVCPPLPKPPPWCFCKLCYIFSQKAGKGWCKAILILVAIYVSLVICAAFLGLFSFSTSNTFWQNLGAAISIFGTSVVVLWYDKKCSDCCVACALLLAMVLAIIAVIIMVIYGVQLTWMAGLIALLAVFLLWLMFNSWCNSYAAQHLTEDTWCKD